MIRELEYEDATVRRWALWSDDRSERIGTDVEDISPETKAEVSNLNKIEAVLVELETFAQSTGTMTSAELTAAVRKMAGALAALARLHLRRFT